MGQPFKRISKIRAGFFSSPSTAYPFWLFVVFCIFFLYYSFWYVPRRQARILDEDFRDLGSAVDLLTFMIQGDLRIVATQAERVSNPQYQGAKTAAELNQAAQVSFYTDCSGDTSAPEGISFRVTSDHGRQILRTQYRSHSNYHVCVDRDLGELVALAMGSSTAELDGVALIQENGEVVYESAQRDFRLANIGNLLEAAFEPNEQTTSFVDTRAIQEKLAAALAAIAKKEPANPVESQEQWPGPADWKDVRYTALLDANLGKASYKLLVQPVLLPFYTGTPQEHAATNHHLTLVGIVSTETLNGAAHKLPPVRLALFITCFVLLLLIFWPVLKLWAMGPAERFQVKEICFFAFSMLFALSLLTLVMLYETRRTDNTMIDEHIRQISDAIDRNLAEDLRRGTALLEAASAQQESSPSTPRGAGTQKLAAASFKCTQGEHTDVENKGQLESKCNVLKNYWPAPTASDPGAALSNAIQGHPWFDQMFWVNADGDQVAKWSVKESITPPVQVSGYAFFHDVRKKELWSSSPPPDPCEETHADPATGSFLLEPLYSPNTGEYNSLVLQPGKTDRYNLRVLSSALVSVNGPVLPSDFGFAIVDENGVVRFHSAAIRNSREHILQRLQPSEKLRNAMAGDDVWFDGVYRERPVRVNARPFRYIRNAPWTLVVFHDTSERDKFLIHVLVLALGCFGVYYLYLIGLFGVAYLLRPLIKVEDPAHTAPWYVPSAKKVPSIMAAYVFLSISIVIYYTLLVGGSLRSLWIWQGLVPLLVAAMVWFALVWAPVPWGKSWPDISPKRAKLAMLVVVALMGVNVAVLPAITFFKICYLDARVPYRQTAQVQLQQALEKHTSSFSEYLDKIKQAPAKLEEQRRGERLDRYDYVWFNPVKRFKFDKSNVEYNCKTASVMLTAVDTGQSCRPGEDPFLCMVRSFFRVDTGLPKWTWQIYRTPPASAGTNVVSASANGQPNLAEDWLLMKDVSNETEPVLTPLPPAPKPGFLINVVVCFLLVLVTMLLFGYRFGWDHPGEELFPDATEPQEGDNKLLLVYPRRKPKIVLSGDDFQPYSLPELIEQPTLSLGKEKFVVIRDFERGVQDSKLRQRTLDILEKLVAEENKTTILLCTVDPVYWLENYEDTPVKLRPPDEWELYLRWMAVMNAFRKEQDNLADCDDTPIERDDSEGPPHIYQHDEVEAGLSSSSSAALATTPAQERNTREECHLLWNTCTPREKLVLWQLAGQAVPNPKNNHALDQLMRRGLVRHDEPRFVIKNQGFENFIKTGLPRREVEFLYPVKADTAWRGLRWVLFYSLLALVLVLIFNSADLWETGIVSIAAVGGTAVPLIKAAYDAFKSFSGSGVKAA